MSVIRPLGIVIGLKFDGSPSITPDTVFKFGPKE